jgi:hypothetical protein
VSGERRGNKAVSLGHPLQPVFRRLFREDGVHVGEGVLDGAEMEAGGGDGGARDVAEQRSGERDL